MDPDYDVFAIIAESETLSAAAHKLRMSPASLSRKLARLEHRLGARLVHRTTRRMALTPQGHQFHRDLMVVRNALEEAENRVSGQGEELAGPLRLTAPTSFGRMHLAPLLSEFILRYPRIELDVDLSDSFVDLPTSRYDLAIRIAVTLGAGLVGHRLATSRRVLCASPAYLDGRDGLRTLGDLKGQSLLAAHGQLPWLLDGPAGAVLWEGESIVQTNSSEVVRELTLGGAGIALRSLWDVSPALESGALVRVLPDYEGSRDAAIFIAHAPVPRLSAPARVFVEHLTTRFADASWNRALAT